MRNLILGIILGITVTTLGADGTSKLINNGVQYVQQVVNNLADKNK